MTLSGMQILSDVGDKVQQLSLNGALISAARSTEMKSQAQPCMHHAYPLRRNLGLRWP